MRAVRSLSGLVAGGLVVLAAVVIGFAVLGDDRGFPGPGDESVTWHVLGALVAVAAQVFADRRRGPAAFAGSAVVFVAAGLLIWTQWWG